MSTPRTPSDLLLAALAADAARPLLTFYDDATGERVELSVATFGNWVAKTANLLADGLLAEPGSRVELRLPPHWQTAVWLSACWAVGAVAAPDGHSVAADVLVAGPDDLEREAASRAAETVGLSLRPMNAPLRQQHAGVTDYAAEVLTYGDVYVPVSPVGAGSAALEVGRSRWTAGDLARLADERAAAWGLGRQDRVLTTLPYTSLDGVLAGLLAPLACGAGIVLCRNLDEHALAARTTAERVTVCAGVSPPPGSGVRSLSVPS